MYLEISAVILTLVSIYLTIKNNIHCWWTGIISNLLYFFLFQEKHIWADMSLQWIFIIQGMWAWWMWAKPKQLYFKDHIRKSTSEENLNNFLFGVVAWAVLFPLLVLLKGNNPPLDALNTTCSILGIYLLGKRRIEAWYFWILTDIISILLYWRTDLVLTSVLYIICLVLAISGLIKWKNLAKKDGSN